MIWHRNQKEILENNQHSKKYARNHCFFTREGEKSFREIVREWLEIRKHYKNLKNYIKRTKIHWYSKKLHDDVKNKLKKITKKTGREQWNRRWLTMFRWNGKRMTRNKKRTVKRLKITLKE